MRLLFVLLFAVQCFAAAPVVFYSDLDSGPATGGENNQGVYVSIYGRNFGATGTITVCGTATRTPVIYGANNNFTNGPATDMATFQLGAGTTGTNCDIVLTTAGGSSTLASAFTVRSGNIYCVDSVGGSDSNPGTFAGGCKAKLQSAYNLMAAGDILYVKTGTYNTLDGAHGPLLFNGSGTSGNPKAIVGYPGSVHTIGDSSSSTVSLAIQGNSQDSAPCDYHTISNLGGSGGNVYGGTGDYAAGIGFTGCAHTRVVNNRMSCPNENNAQACLFSSSGLVGGTTVKPSAFIKWFGNEVYNVGTSVVGGAQKLTHSTYLGTDSHDAEVGWNYIHDNHACRGIQMHSSPLDLSNGAGWTQDPTGNPLYNMSIHDNYVDNVGCDCVNPVTVDPSLGAVKIYNNRLTRCGTGNNADGAQSYLIYSGVYVAGESNKVYTASAGCQWSSSGSPQAINVVGNASCHFQTDLQVGWSLCYLAPGSSTPHNYGQCNVGPIASIADQTHLTLSVIPSPYNRPWVTFDGTGYAYTNADFYFMKTGTGNVEVYNNTCYDNGFASGSNGCYCRAGAAPKQVLLLKNNIMAQTNGERYSCSSQVAGDGTEYVSGSYDLFYNYGTSGDSPAVFFTNSQTTNPGFTNTSTLDLSLSAQSGGAYNHGTDLTATVPTDILGITRPQFSVVDIGAYEFAGSTPVMGISGATLKGVTIR